MLLPDEIDGLPALEAGLTAEKLTRWLASASAKRKVDVTLPRFKLTSSFSLARTLAAMGMPLAFDADRADFSGMSTEEKLYISAVLHKAFVDVNEKGTEAAAATGVVMADPRRHAPQRARRLPGRSPVPVPDPRQPHPEHPVPGQGGQPAGLSTTPPGERTGFDAMFFVPRSGVVSRSHVVAGLQARGRTGLPYDLRLRSGL